MAPAVLMARAVGAGPVVLDVGASMALATLEVSVAVIPLAGAMAGLLKVQAESAAVSDLQPSH